MIPRHRRLRTALLPLLLLIAAAWGLGPAGAQPGPKAPAGTPAPSAVASTAAHQDGLPPELTIHARRLDQEQKALESMQAWLAANNPNPGFVARIGNWFKRLVTGQAAPTSSSLTTILASGAAMNGKLVAIEGLYGKQADGTETLACGAEKIELNRLPHTVVDGFPTKDPNGLPMRAEGIVILQQQGAVLQLNKAAPAPTLTAVRLARCHELRETPTDTQKAVGLYQAATEKPRGEPAEAFAMVRGGNLAEHALRDRKLAVKLYNRAWELEGRAKSAARGKAPTTWVQDAAGDWETMTLREAVGEPLDTLNSHGFWYKFCDTFVTVCGGNAGLGLILMAIVTRLLLYPLTKKQIDSSRAMQKLQPEIKALQEKHGGDKTKFNEEFWRLCKQNNVNPLGGCLPLIIQMPLLIAVYRGIQAYVVQLAGHGFLWVPSLADPDLILLVLYTASMVAFQKLTMKTQPISDPQQAQQQNMMVWMMPIMFFMFFQSMPSGFILYWLGTNLIYLPQQYFGTRVPGEQKSASDAERTTTLTPGTPSGASDGASAGGVGSWLDRLLGKTPAPQEGNPATSYEEKRQAEKRAQRRPTRRRRPRRP
jgi:YidC/Oxa1 family membrane protein insertase